MENRNNRGSRAPRSEAESLARSHSVASNAKLTFLVLLAAIFFAAFFVALGFYAVREDTLFLVLSMGSGVIALIGLFLINRFRR